MVAIQLFYLERLLVVPGVESEENDRFSFLDQSGGDCLADYDPIWD